MNQLFGDIFDSLLGGMHMEMNRHQSFENTYQCYPIAFAESKQDLEHGNKIILPPSALQALTRMQIDFPMFFRVVNPAASAFTHCGVMEFSAPEGIAYLPLWMMSHLKLREEDAFFIKYTTLSKGELVVLQPHETKFTELSNPRAVLERTLRHFACLTKGDTIQIVHGDQIFAVNIIEVTPDTPGHAISVIETDLRVEFKEPIDYQEAPIKKSDPIEDEHILKPNSPKNQDISEYFEKLGVSGSKGYRLKDNGTSENAPKDKNIDQKKYRISEVQGKWRYFYEIDPSTNSKRLIRRTKAK